MEFFVSVDFFALTWRISQALKEQMTMLRKCYDAESSVAFAVSYAIHITA